MTRVLKAYRLKKGDKIGIIAPAGPIKEDELKEGIRILKDHGFQIELSRSLFKSSNLGYIAGSIKERVDDLHEMFERKDIKAILCARGGYGSMQLLEYIDYELIKKNPKMFIGYSDITALHLAFLKKIRFITFHGPMLKDLVYLHHYYLKMFFFAIKGEMPDNITEKRANTLIPGTTEGILIGGNLSIISHLIGTPYLPILDNMILFLEDINEPYYKIDRMLTHLKLSGIFKNVSGLILGLFKNCGKQDLIEQIITEILSDLDFPILSNFSIGHSDKNLTIPLGIRVCLDAEKKSIEFLESPIKNEAF